MKNHNDQTVIEVLITIRDEDWGIYGPSFPYHLQRYADFLSKEEFMINDPVYGNCFSYRITLNDLGKMFLKYPWLF